MIDDLRAGRTANFHRLKRSKGTFKNELEDIRGIGSNTAKELLKAFRSVKNIKEQPVDELAKVIGRSKAQIVKNHFSGTDEETGIGN